MQKTSLITNKTFALQVLAVCKMKWKRKEKRVDLRCKETTMNVLDNFRVVLTCFSLQFPDALQTAHHFLQELKKADVC